MNIFTLLTVFLLISISVGCSGKKSSGAFDLIEFDQSNKTNYEVVEGQTLSFELAVLNPNDLPLSFQWPELVALNDSTFDKKTFSAMFSFTNTSVTYTVKPDFEQAGDYKIVFSLPSEEGDEDIGSVEGLVFTVSLKVINKNQHPIIIKSESKEYAVRKGETHRLDLELETKPGDMGKFKIGSIEPSSTSFELRNKPNGKATIIFTPTQKDADNRRYSVTLFGFDGDDESDPLTLTYHVFSDNLPPQVVQLPSETKVKIGQVANIQVNATDKEKDAISFEVTGIEDIPGASFTEKSPGKGVLTIAPLSGDCGEYDLKIRVADKTSPDVDIEGSYTTTTVKIVSDPPIFSPLEQGEYQIFATQILSLEFNVKDPDADLGADTLNFSIESEPPLMEGQKEGASYYTFDQENLDKLRFSLFASPDDPPMDYRLKITAIDSCQLTSILQFKVKVLPNNLPVVTPLKVVMKDENGNETDISQDLVQGKARLKENDTMVIQYQLDDSDVEDRLLLSANLKYRLNLNSSWSEDYETVGISFKPGDRQIVIHPSYTFATRQNPEKLLYLRVEASDHPGVSSNFDYQITVVDRNASPIFEKPVVDTFSINFGDEPPLKIGVELADIDGDSITISIERVSFTQNLGEQGFQSTVDIENTSTIFPQSTLVKEDPKGTKWSFKIAPVFGVHQIGTYQILIKGVDVAAGVSNFNPEPVFKTLDITITNDNRPPILRIERITVAGQLVDLPLSHLVVEENQTLEIFFDATDPNGPGENFTFKMNDAPQFALIEEGIFTFTPSYSQSTDSPSEYFQPIFTALDTENFESNPVSVTIEVVNRNRRPVFVKIGSTEIEDSFTTSSMEDEEKVERFIVDDDEVFHLSIEAIDDDEEQVYFFIPNNDPINATRTVLPSFATATSNEVTYTPSSNDAGKEFQFAVYICDLESPTDADFTSKNFCSRAVLGLYVNNLTFLSFPRLPVGNKSTVLKTGDLDTDNLPDLVAGSNEQNIISIYYNIVPEASIYSERYDYQLSTSRNNNADGEITDVCLGNFLTNDGSSGNDVVVVSGSKLLFMQNKGERLFQIQPIPSNTKSLFQIECGRINNDDFEDIVAISFDDSTLTVLIGNGQGQFKEFTNVYTFTGNPRSLTVFDQNNDGRIDYVATANTENDTASLIRLQRSNKADSSLLSKKIAEEDYLIFDPVQTTLSTGDVPRDIKIDDLNLDGVVDIVVSASGESSVSVFLGEDIGQGRINFADHEERYDVGKFPTAIAIVDLDGDPYWIQDSAVNVAKFTPTDVEHLALGTAQGFNHSYNGGATFTRENTQYCAGLSGATSGIDILHGVDNSEFILVGSLDKGICLISEQSGRKTIKQIPLAYDHDQNSATEPIKHLAQVKDVRFVGDENHLLIATLDGLLWSIDGGKIFQLIKDNGSGSTFKSNQMTCLDVLSIDDGLGGVDNHVLIGTRLGLYVSHDFPSDIDEILASVNTNLQSNMITDVAFDPRDQIGYSFFVGTNKGMARTINDGDTFTNYFSGETITAISVHPGTNPNIPRVLIASLGPSASEPSLTNSFIRISNKQGEVLDFTSSVLNSNGFTQSNHIINDVTFARSGDGNTFFLATTRGGLLSIDGGVTYQFFNATRKPEIAVTDQLGGTVSILINNGDGTFNRKRKLQLVGGRNPSAIVGLNFNSISEVGLKKMDLAVLDITSSQIILLENKGGGIFPAASNYYVGPHPLSMQVVDMDPSDGEADWDIVVGTGGSTEEQPYLVVMMNNGDNSFNRYILDFQCKSFDGVIIRNYRCQQGIESLAIGHLDDQGSDDLVFVSKALNNVTVVKDLFIHMNLDAVNQLHVISEGITNLPDFATRQLGEIGLGPSKVKISDINSDGFNDIFVLYEESNKITVFLNRSGRFDDNPDNIVELLIGDNTYPSDFLIADLIGDNEKDVAVVSPNLNNVIIFSSEYYACTAGEQLIGACNQFKYYLDTGNFPNSISAGDVNPRQEKKYLDILVGNTNDATVMLFKNGKDGLKGNFDDPMVYPTGKYPGYVSLVDIDPSNVTDQLKNGIDILSLNKEDDSISIFLNQSADGKFIPFLDLLVGSNPVALEVKDIDNDGDNVGHFDRDIIVLNENTNNVSILYNLEILNQESESGFIDDRLSLVIISNSHDSTTHVIPDVGIDLSETTLNSNEKLQLRFLLKRTQDVIDPGVLLEFNDIDGGGWTKILPPYALYNHANNEFVFDLENVFYAECDKLKDFEFRFRILVDGQPVAEADKYITVRVSRVYSKPVFYSTKLPTYYLGEQARNKDVFSYDPDGCSAVIINLTNIPQELQNIVSFDQSSDSTVGSLQVDLLGRAGDTNLIGLHPMKFSACKDGGFDVETNCNDIDTVLMIETRPLGFSDPLTVVVLYEGQILTSNTPISVKNRTDLFLQVNIEANNPEKLRNCGVEGFEEYFRPRCDVGSTTQQGVIEIKYENYRSSLIPDRIYPLNIYAETENGIVVTKSITWKLVKQLSPYWTNPIEKVISSLNQQVNIDLTFTDDENDQIVFYCDMKDGDIDSPVFFKPCAENNRFIFSPNVFAEEQPSESRSFGMEFLPILDDVNKTYTMRITTSDLVNPELDNIAVFEVVIENQTPVLNVDAMTGLKVDPVFIPQLPAIDKSIEYLPNGKLVLRVRYNDLETPQLPSIDFDQSPDSEKCSFTSESVTDDPVACLYRIEFGKKKIFDNNPTGSIFFGDKYLEVELGYDQNKKNSMRDYIFTARDNNNAVVSKGIRVKYINIPPGILLQPEMDLRDHDRLLNTVNIGEIFKIRVSATDEDQATPPRIFCAESREKFDCASPQINYLYPCEYPINPEITFNRSATTTAIAPSIQTSRSRFNLYYKVADDFGATACASTYIEITKVNKPPVITGIRCNIISVNNVYNVVEGNAEKTLSCTLSASDPNADAVSYFSVNLPANSTLNPQIGTFHFTPDFHQSGNYSIRFKARDPFTTNNISEEFVLNISVIDSNQRPVFTSFDERLLADQYNTEILDETLDVSYVMDVNDKKSWNVGFFDLDNEAIACEFDPNGLYPLGASINTADNYCFIQVISDPADRGKIFDIKIVIREKSGELKSSYLVFSLFINGMNYQDIPTLSTGFIPKAMEIIDVHKDKKPDFIVTSADDGTIATFKNYSPVTPYYRRNTQALGGLGIKHCLGDFNNDGFNDYVFLEDGAYNIVINLNDYNNPGIYKSVINYPLGKEPIALICGDVGEDRRSDGLIGFLDTDVLILEKDEKKIRVFYNNNGTGTLTEVQPFIFDYIPTDIAIYDNNGDSVMDIVAVLFGYAKKLTYLTVADGGIVSSNVWLTTGNNPVSITIANMDGKYGGDIILTDLEDDTVEIFYSANNLTEPLRTFSQINTAILHTDRLPKSVTIGDFSGNGLPDLAVLVQAKQIIEIIPTLRDGVPDPSKKFNLVGGLKPVSTRPLFRNADVPNNIQDLAILDRSAKKVIIHRNQSAKLSSFTENAKELMTADFDGDGLEEVVAFDVSTDIIYFHDIDFSQQMPSLSDPNINDAAHAIGIHIVGMFVGHFDNDIYPDIALYGTLMAVLPSESDRIIIAVMNSDGVPLTNGSTGITILEYQEDFVEDQLPRKILAMPIFDNIGSAEGNDEIVLLNYGKDRLDIYTNDGNGSFQQSGRKQVSLPISSYGPIDAVYLTPDPSSGQNKGILAVISKLSKNMVIGEINNDIISWDYEAIVDFRNEPLQIHASSFADIPGREDIAVLVNGQFKSWDELHIFKAKVATTGVKPHLLFNLDEQNFLPVGGDSSYITPYRLTNGGNIGLAVYSMMMHNISVVIHNDDSTFTKAEPIALNSNIDLIGLQAIGGLAEMMLAVDGNLNKSFIIGLENLNIFDTAKFLVTGPSPNGMVVTDFNADSLSDILVTNGTPSCANEQSICEYTMSIFEQNLQKDFQSFELGGVGSIPHSPISGKLSKKSDDPSTAFLYPDVFYIDQSLQSVSVLINEMAPRLEDTFKRKIDYLVPFPVENLVVGDIDLDGDDDLLAIGSLANTFQLLDTNKRRNLPEKNDNGYFFTNFDAYYGNSYGNDLVLATAADGLFHYSQDGTVIDQYVSSDSTTDADFYLLPDNRVNVVHFDQNDREGDSFFVGTENGAVSIQNGGETSLYFNLGSLQVTSIDYAVPDIDDGTPKKFLVGTMNGAFLTSDNGMHFSIIGPSKAIYKVLMSDANTFLLATDDGVTILRNNGLIIENYLIGIPIFDLDFIAGTIEQMVAISEDTVYYFPNVICTGTPNCSDVHTTHDPRGIGKLVKVSFIDDPISGNQYMVGGEQGIIINRNAAIGNNGFVNTSQLPSANITDSVFMKIVDGNKATYHFLVGTNGFGAVLYTELYGDINGNKQLLSNNRVFYNSDSLPSTLGFNDSITAVAICSKPTDQQLSFIIGTQKGAFLSLDGGTSFTKISYQGMNTNNGAYITSLDCRVANGLFYLIGTKSGAVYARNDGTQTVINTASSVLPSPMVTTVNLDEVDPDCDSLVIGTDKGITISNDAAKTFSAYVMPGENVSKIYYYQGDLSMKSYAGLFDLDTDGIDDAVAVTRDGGRTFKTVLLSDLHASHNVTNTAGDAIVKLAFRYTNTKCIYQSRKVSGGDFQIIGAKKTGIYVTKNNWVTSSRIDLGNVQVNDVTWVNADASNCESFIVGTDAGIKLTNNNGISFVTDDNAINNTRINGAMPSENIIQIIDIMNQDPGDFVPGLRPNFLASAANIEYIALTEYGFFNHLFYEAYLNQQSVHYYFKYDPATDTGLDCVTGMPKIDVARDSFAGSVYFDMAMLCNNDPSNNLGIYFTETIFGNDWIRLYSGTSNLAGDDYDDFVTFSGGDDSFKIIVVRIGDEIFRSKNLSLPWDGVLQFEKVEVLSSKTINTFDVFNKTYSMTDFLVGTTSGLFHYTMAPNGTLFYDTYRSFNAGVLTLKEAPFVLDCDMISRSQVLCSIADDTCTGLPAGKQCGIDALPDSGYGIFIGKESGNELVFRNVEMDQSNKNIVSRISLSRGEPTKAVISDESGLYAFDTSNDSISARLIDVSSDPPLPSSVIRSVNVLADNNQNSKEILVGTDNGLFIIDGFDTTDDSARIFKGNNSLTRNLGNDTILAFETEMNAPGNFIYLAKSGLYLSEDNGETYRILRKGVDIPELEYTTVTTIGSGANKRIILGTTNGYVIKTFEKTEYYQPDWAIPTAISNVLFLPDSSSDVSTKHYLFATSQGLGMTDDGGSSYKNFLADPGIGGAIKDMAYARFENSDHFALASQFSIASTLDGGITFETFDPVNEFSSPKISDSCTATIPGPGSHIRRLVQIDENTLFFIMDKHLFYTFDDSNTFFVKEFTTGNLLDLAIQYQPADAVYSIYLATDNGVQIIDNVSVATLKLCQGDPISITYFNGKRTNAIDVLIGFDKNWLAGGNIGYDFTINGDTSFDAISFMHEGVPSVPQNGQTYLTDNIIKKVAYNQGDFSGRSTFALTDNGLFIVNYLYTDSSFQHKIGDGILMPTKAVIADIIVDRSADRSYPDIAVLNKLDGSVYVYETTGKFQLDVANPLILDAGLDPSDLAVGYINDDGYPDLVVTDHNDNSILLFFNDTGNSFKPSVAYQIGKGPDTVIMTDLDPLRCATPPCRWDEVLVSVSGENIVGLIANHKGQNLLRNSIFDIFTGEEPVAIVVEDIDNDSIVSIDGIFDDPISEVADFDLLILNKGSNTITILYNLEQ